MNWHLFSITASDADGTHGYLVSAQSGSQAKAQELAKAAVLDDCGTEEQPATIDCCTFLGIVDRDVWEPLGLLAE